jgi:hypothetical protein
MHADCPARCDARSNLLKELAGRVRFRARADARLWDEVVAVPDSSRLSGGGWVAGLTRAGFPSRSLFWKPVLSVFCPTVSFIGG